MKSINYGRQQINSDDIVSVTEALNADYLTQGPLVTKFEDDFKSFVNSSEAIAVCNATAALHLANLALGVTKATRVISTPLSFVATTNSVLYSGGSVEFVDIDAKNYCIDLNKVEDLLKKSKPNTYAGLIPVSFAGYPVNTQDLRQIADKYGLWIIEDSCHAPGAKFKKTSGDWSQTGSGEFADISVFSFHPVKHIATGEGGMLTTRNSKLAQNLRDLRSHGIVRDSERLSKNDGPWYYEMQSLGYNYRLPDLNCSLGISQLKRIEKNLSRRHEIANKYHDELENLPIQLPEVDDNSFHAYHLYVIQTDRRLELFNFLKSKNINAQIHYIPIHTQPYYQSLYGKQSFEICEKYYSRTLSLPMYHGMTNAEQEYVIDQLKYFFLK